MPTDARRHVATVMPAGGATPLARLASASASGRRGRAEPRVSYLVGRLDRSVRQAIDVVVRQHGLTVTQYTALSVLGADTLLSNAQMARRALVTPQAMHEVLLSLEQQGFVRRDPDPANGRVLRTSLTSLGEAMLRRCDEHVDRLEAKMTVDLTADERAALAGILTRCLASLRATS